MPFVNDYWAFHNLSDGNGWHADFHVSVGGKFPTAGNPTCGDVSDGAYSVNDPVFFCKCDYSDFGCNFEINVGFYSVPPITLVVHHGFVDKVWAKWQNLCPSFKRSYNGFLQMGGGDFRDDTATDTEGTANAGQALTSWSDYYVYDVLDTTGGVLCYEYSKSALDLEGYSFPNCPAVERSFYWLENVVKSLSTGGKSSASVTNATSFFALPMDANNFISLESLQKKKPNTLIELTSTETDQIFSSKMRTVSKDMTQINGISMAHLPPIAQRIVLADERISLDKEGNVIYTRYPHHSPPDPSNSEDLQYVKGVDPEIIKHMHGNIWLEQAQVAFQNSVVDDTNNNKEKKGLSPAVQKNLVSFRKSSLSKNRQGVFGI
jgi:hypothetical protein